MVKGIGASPGIAIGRAFVLPDWEWELPETLIAWRADSTAPSNFGANIGTRSF